MITALVLGVSAAAISLPRGGSDDAEKPARRLDAFNDLNSGETWVFNSLLTAAIEIDQTHDMEDGRWMDIAELEELYIPPFARDAAWKNQGKITWKLAILHADINHIALYRGIPATKDVRGTFLLVMLHEHKKKQGNSPDGPGHAPYEIWLHPDRAKDFPAIITDQALIAAGWSQVVAQSGEDEFKKLKGKTF